MSVNVNKSGGDHVASGINNALPHQRLIANYLNFPRRNTHIAYAIKPGLRVHQATTLNNELKCTASLHRERYRHEPQHNNARNGDKAPLAY